MRITKLSKILSIVLAFCMTVGLIVTTDAADFNDPLKYVDSYEYKFVKEFDLMPICNYDDFQADKPMTRAEYATILCKLGNLNPSVGGNEFVDVAGHKYEKNIAAVNTAGLMVGFDKYTFLPDKNITIYEAIKPMVVLMGYENEALAQGGYPNGYAQVASDLKMLSGIETAGNEVASRGDIARIIYNTRNVEVYSVVDFVNPDDEPKTYMTNYMGIDCVRGIVTDNGITGLRSDGESQTGRIKIGNRVFAVESTFEAREYIGRYVEAYYTNDDDDASETIKYIHEDSRYAKNEIKFDITDFLDLTDRTISYENEDGRTKKIKLGNTANIIYNNKASKVINEAMFDYDYGTVTYIPATNDADDTIIIEGYVTWYITSIDQTLELIRTNTNNKPIDGSYQLEVKGADLGTSLFIEDEYGLEAKVDDVPMYSVVDICKNDNFTLLKVAMPDIKEMTVKARTKVGDKVALSFTDGQVIPVAPYYAQSGEFESISSGALYYVYKNRAGDIAALTTIENTGMKVGYLLKAYYDDVEEIGYIKVLTTSNTIERYQVDDRITFSDDHNITTRPKFTDIYFQLNERAEDDRVMNYFINGDNIVKKIYLPVEIGYDRELGRLGCIVDEPAPSGWWEKGRKNFGRSFLADSNVGTFRVYDAETDESKRYLYGAHNSFASGYNSNVPTKAYNYEPNSLYADVLWQKYMEVGSELPISGYNVAVITDMSEEILYNEEAYIKMVVARAPRGESLTFYVKKEDVTKVPDTVATTPEMFHEIGEGDVIAYQASTSDPNLLNSIVLWWDASLPNGIDPENGRRGWEPGSAGYNNSSNQANPHFWYGGPAVGQATEQGRSFFGYVYYAHTKGGFVVTNQELSCKPYDDSNPPGYYTEAYIPGADLFIVVNFKDGDVIVKPGTYGDVRTYLADGRNCSRIIMNGAYGRMDTVIIINGELE